MEKQKEIREKKKNAKTNFQSETSIWYTALTYTLKSEQMKEKNKFQCINSISDSKLNSEDRNATKQAHHFLILRKHQLGFEVNLIDVLRNNTKALVYSVDFPQITLMSCFLIIRGITPLAHFS